MWPYLDMETRLAASSAAATRSGTTVTTEDVCPDLALTTANRLCIWLYWEPLDDGRGCASEQPDEAPGVTTATPSGPLIPEPDLVDLRRVLGRALQVG